MNMNKLKLALTTVLLCAGLPFTASAYETTSQTATLVAPDTIMYTVSYTFGFLNRETKVPIAALRAENDSKFFHVGYNFMHDAEVIESGLSNAIVLTSDEDVEIVDGAYYLPEGRSAEFTLVSFYTIPAEQLSTVALQITELPFEMIEDEEGTLTGVAPAQLVQYRTPSIYLQPSVAITVQTTDTSYNPNMK